MLKRIPRIALSAVPAAFAVLACGGPEGLSPSLDPVMFEPTDPKFVLMNLSSAFDWRHRKILKANLCDDFLFYFDPHDVGATVNGYVIPERWTRDEFYAAAANLFVEAYNADLDFVLYRVPPPGPGETYFRVEDVVTACEVYVDPYTGYATYGGYSDFEFRGYAPGDGKIYWHVARWWDRTYVEPPGDGQVEYATLGRILATYH